MSFVRAPKIGILAIKPQNIFTNGCVQQIYFLCKVLRNAGAVVSLISVHEDFVTFGIGDASEEVVFTNNTTNFNEYDLIILGSLVLLESRPDNLKYIENMCSHKNLCIVQFICGNLFILHQEEFVFGHHEIMHHISQSFIHKTWLMEMYDYSKDFIRIASRTPTDTSSYVWDVDFIQEYIKLNDILKTTIPANNSMVNLLIFEPNMSVHKNALVPLLICEDYYRKYPHRVNKIYIFCANESPNIHKYIQNLDCKARIEIQGRIIMPHVIDIIKKNNPYLNIVISYTLLNKLNFIHLELMYIGVPIIHNCEPFKANGLYYNDIQCINLAVDYIEPLRINFKKDSYKQLCEPIIQEFASSNKNRIHAYEHLLLNTLPQLRATSKPTTFEICKDTDEELIRKLLKTCDRDISIVCTDAETLLLASSIPHHSCVIVVDGTTFHKD